MGPYLCLSFIMLLSLIAMKSLFPFGNLAMCHLLLLNLYLHAVNFLHVSLKLHVFIHSVWDLGLYKWWKCCLYHSWVSTLKSIVHGHSWKTKKQLFNFLASLVSTLRLCFAWIPFITRTFYGYSSDVQNLPKVTSHLISKLDRVSCREMLF